MPLKNELSVNLGLPVAPIIQDAELATELQRVYNAIRAVARALDVYTGAVGEESIYWDQAGVSRFAFGLNSKFYLQAGENIPYGSIVGVKSDKKLYRAQDAVVRCCGFLTMTAGVSTNEWAEAQFCGLFPPFPAATLTAGNIYYNSVTAGSVGVAGSGPTWNQAVGYALSDTQLILVPQL